MLFIPAKQYEYEEVIKRSRFIGNIRPVSTIEVVRETIAETAKKYRDSDHNCWAYIVGTEGETCHFSDAGEPSGTAGKPILRVLQKNNLTNAVIVVSRYFGGVKFGVRGLIDAYRRTAETVVEKVTKIPLISKDCFKITTSYKYWEILQQRLMVLEEEYWAEKSKETEGNAINLMNVEFGEEVEIAVSAYQELNLRTFLEAEQQASSLKYSFKGSSY